VFELQSERVSVLAAGPRVRVSYDGHWMRSGLPFMAFMVVGCSGLGVLLQVGGRSALPLLIMSQLVLVLRFPRCSHLIASRRESGARTSTHSAHALSVIVTTHTSRFSPLTVTLPPSTSHLSPLTSHLSSQPSTLTSHLSHTPLDEPLHTGSAGRA